MAVKAPNLNELNFQFTKGTLYLTLRGIYCESIETKSDSEIWVVHIIRLLGP